MYITTLDQRVYKDRIFTLLADTSNFPKVKFIIEDDNSKRTEIETKTLDSQQWNKLRYNKSLVDLDETTELTLSRMWLKFRNLNRGKL